MHAWSIVETAMYTYRDACISTIVFCITEHRTACTVQEVHACGVSKFNYCLHMIDHNTKIIVLVKHTLQTYGVCAFVLYMSTTHSYMGYSLSKTS